MEIVWRKSAITSLLELDQWRNSIELPSIAIYLKDSIQYYFERQDFSLYIPGRHVLIKKMPIDLRMVLVSIGKTDPYKVFYRVTANQVQIYLIRHPYQKSLD